jgi:MoaA/NifB/PqqE/SkfB family radical SAM enzyme
MDMNKIASSARVIWDITYACQLRCTHCYSESGRRASRKLPLEDMLRVADAFGAMNPRSVHLAGGEPLLLEELPRVASRISSYGIPVALFTNGMTLTQVNVSEVARLFSATHVSVDGATAPVHDGIRGRDGSFEAALGALSALDRWSAEQRHRGEARYRFGLEYTVVQSNFHELELLCREILPRFPELGFVNIGAAVPSGMASLERYAEEELLTEEQLASLRDPAFGERLRALAPGVERLDVTDNFSLQMHPDDVKRGKAASGVMQVEPDGRVRSMAAYEGTVGSLLDEDPLVLWQRAQARHAHPFLEQELSTARTMMEWAAATRRIDRHFAAAEDLLRIKKRR